MVKNILLEACTRGETKEANRLLKLGKIPDIECMRECCNNIDNLKGIFYQIIKTVKPDYECLKNLCININNINVDKSVQCIKKILKFKIKLEYECIGYLIDSEIENNDFVCIIMEILNLLKKQSPNLGKLDINSTKKIMKKRNVLGRLASYIGKIDEECYNLLITNSMTLKSDIIKAFIANGLIISPDMLRYACKYKYNNNVIKNILHYCKDIKIDRDCLELLCNNAGNCDIVIDYIDDFDIDVNKLFKYICINGNQY
jgi:coenzyme F420-reducing hydrogenase delta subunit